MRGPLSLGQRRSASPDVCPGVAVGFGALKATCSEAKGLDSSKHLRLSIVASPIACYGVVDYPPFQARHSIPEPYFYINVIGEQIPVVIIR